MTGPPAEPHPAISVVAPTEREIRVERTFDAARARVWRALTDPALVAQWWGRGHPLEIERMDLAPGGRWRYVETAPDGSHAFEGHYREVTPPERIVQTFEWDGMPGHVNVETTELHLVAGGRTKVTTTARFPTAAARDSMLRSGKADGMARSYLVLDQILESMAS